jgi:hypothetical protein
VRGRRLLCLPRNTRGEATKPTALSSGLCGISGHSRLFETVSSLPPTFRSGSIFSLGLSLSRRIVNAVRSRFRTFRTSSFDEVVAWYQSKNHLARRCCTSPQRLHKKLHLPTRYRHDPRNPPSQIAPRCARCDHQTRLRCVRDSSSTSASGSEMPELRAVPRRPPQAMGLANPTSAQPAQPMGSVKPTSALRPPRARGSVNPTSAPRPLQATGLVNPTFERQVPPMAIPMAKLAPQPPQATDSVSPTSARPVSPTAMRTATPAPSAVPSRRAWPLPRPTRLQT